MTLRVKGLDVSLRFVTKTFYHGVHGAHGEKPFFVLLLLPLGEGRDEGRSKIRILDLNSNPTLIASDGHSAHPCAPVT
jgi:hypothetical protein